VQGRKEGEGTLKFADGSVFHGSFLNNEIHGFGTYSWADEKEYVGEWISNKM
jgi:hypothetical protein